MIWILLFMEAKINLIFPKNMFMPKNDTLKNIFQYKSNVRFLVGLNEKSFHINPSNFTCYTMVSCNCNHTNWRILMAMNWVCQCWQRSQWSSQLSQSSNPVLTSTPLEFISKKATNSLTLSNAQPSFCHSLLLQQSFNFQQSQFLQHMQGFGSSFQLHQFCFSSTYSMELRGNYILN